MIQFGMRAHDIAAPMPLTEAMDQLQKSGVRQLQLALEKSISDIDFHYGSYSAGLACRIGEELEQRRLHTAVLGCYINPVHPEEAARKAEVRKFTERLRYAKRMNADLVGTETGRFSPDMSVTPKTDSEECYRLLLESFSEIMDQAERLGVMVGVEGVFDHTLSTPEKMNRFLKDIASPNLEVILDGANLISPETARSREKMQAIHDKAFQLYGDRISVLHIKDCVFDAEGVQVCTPPGEGLIDFTAFFRNIKAEKPDIVGILENSTPERFASDCRYFERLLTEA